MDDEDLIGAALEAAHAAGYADGREPFSSSTAAEGRACEAAEAALRESLARVSAVVAQANFVLGSTSDADYRRLSDLLGALTPDDRRLLGLAP